MSIEVKGLSKIYGTQKAVNNISFKINTGEIVGFLGPNGAGKSTTMKMITGFLHPTKGEAFVGGVNVLKEPLKVSQKVGYLPESNPLYYDMYVREYLSFCADIHKITKNKKERIEEVIQLTGLGKEAHKRIGTLSKGYKQRVGLAQAILHDPEVLILDEPTSGLDPNQIVDIRDLILHLGKNKTVMLSTHIMQEVQAMCSRVIILSSGEIVADDNIEKIQSGPSQNSLKVLFSANVSIKDLKALAGVKHVKAISEKEILLEASDLQNVKHQLMKWAVEKDILIEAMQEHKQSLEEVFRQMTAKNANTAPSK